MSSFQPIITAAFASYTMSRGMYTDRSMVATDLSVVGAATPEQNDGNRINPVQQSGEVGKVDTDYGKPRSLSGDVLDLSIEFRNIDDVQKADADGLDAQKASLEGSAGSEKAQARIQSEAEQATSETLAEMGYSDTVEVDSAIQVEGSGEEAAALGSGSPAGSSELTPEEEQQLKELKARDAEVRQHEMQHVSTGGQYVTGGPTYTYQTGPDGNNYAVGGEVSIDVSPIEGNPEATIQKMQTVSAAALAPAEPSNQDQKVAAAARAAEAKARAELMQQRQEEMSGESEESEEDTSSLNLNAVQQSEQSRVGSNDSSRAASSGKIEIGSDSSKVGVSNSGFEMDKTSTAGNPRLSSQISAAYQSQSSVQNPAGIGGESSTVRFSVFA